MVFVWQSIPSRASPNLRQPLETRETPTPNLQAVLELESSASGDEAVRERIASLPPEVSEVSLLSKLEGKMPIHFHFCLIMKIMQRQMNFRRWLFANNAVNQSQGPSQGHSSQHPHVNVLQNNNVPQHGNDQGQVPQPDDNQNANQVPRLDGNIYLPKFF